MSLQSWIEYDRVGGASGDNVQELIAFTKALRAEVLEWLHRNHPSLSPPGDKSHAQ